MLVDGKWIPTFPNARYLLARAEVERAAADQEGDAQEIFADSVRPILDAGMAELVDHEHEIVEGVRLVPTPGHTPAHCSIVLSSRGDEAIITGDVLHHPIQAALPQISSNFCSDGELAVATRRRLLSHAAEQGSTLLVAHFAGTSGVVVRSKGDAWTIEQT